METCKATEQMMVKTKLQCINVSGFHKLKRKCGAKVLLGGSKQSINLFADVLILYCLKKRGAEKH